MCWYFASLSTRFYLFNTLNVLALCQPIYLVPILQQNTLNVLALCQSFYSVLFLQHPKCLGTMAVLLLSYIFQHPKCIGTMLVLLLRPCSHLFRFAFRSRSGPVPLVRVAFTPAKIDRARSGCGHVTRSHLFRNATGTHTISTPTPAASSTKTVSYRWTDTTSTVLTSDLSAISGDEYFITLYTLYEIKTSTNAFVYDYVMKLNL